MTPSRFPQRHWSEDAAETELPETSPSRGALIPESSVAEVIFSAEGARDRQLCAPKPDRLRPRGIFVPENYEPNYAYPLVVWLHEAGRNERDIAEVLPRISMRNYFGLALRGTTVLKRGPGREICDGHGWSRKHRTRFRFQNDLFASVRNLRQDFHLHTERIFLAGSGDGATMAWELFLSRPEWFAGLAVLGGRFPWGRQPLRRFRDLQGKSLFMSPPADNPIELRRADRVARLMYTAGLEVCVRSHAPNGRLSRALLRRVDCWIMQAIGGCT